MFWEFKIKDQSKTKKQLIDELVELRQQKEALLKKKEQLRAERPYLISFTDLIYAILIGYGISLLHNSVVKERLLGVLFVVFVLILIIYDWYGEHFLSAQVKVGVIATIFDFFALLIYFGLLFFSALSSIFLFLFLAARALRGLAINFLLLASKPSQQQEIKLKAWTISSTLMIIVYLTVFFWFKFLCSVQFLMIAVMTWGITYLISLIVERIWLKRIT